MPRAEEAVEVARQIALSGFPADRIWYAPGNHDGDSGWLVPYHDSLTADGVKAAALGASHDAYHGRVTLTCPAGNETVEFLMLGDTSRHLDIEVCGQSAAPGIELRKAGMPAGAYTLAQVDYLRQRLVTAASTSIPVVVVAHHVPPETTYGSFAGEGRAASPCTGQALHGPASAYQPPARPGLDWPSSVDGLTPRERCDDWSGTAPFIGASPIAQPDWLLRLLDDTFDASGADALRLWVGSHSHIPHPQYTAAGHGMEATISPTTGATPVQVVQAGGLTRWHSGYGASQFVVVEWGCDGAYQVERWSTGDWASPTCGSTAVRPTSYPGAYQMPAIGGAW
jgi:hypothetical protein